MYDPKSEAHEFVGEGREEAIAKAVRFFGVEAEELRICEPSPGDVYGLGGRALVVAQPRNAPAPSARSGREERGERHERPRGRGGDSPRERGRRRGGSERREDRREATRDEVPVFDEPSVGTAAGELGSSGGFLLGVVERLGLGSFELSESEEPGDLLVLELRGNAAKSLAAGDGRAVDALQLLVNQAAKRVDEDARRIVIDIEGNAEARERFLSRLAQRVVRRAQDGGRAVALDPMNGRDRRIIHMAVREYEGVATMSIGEGRYRQVVVVPEGAPEYEEAHRQAEAAAQRDD